MVLLLTSGVERSTLLKKPSPFLAPKTTNKKQLIVDTYSLAPAVYLLRVHTSNGTQTVQLVKK